MHRKESGCLLKIICEQQDKRKGVSKAIYLNLTKKEKNKAVHDKIPAVIKISK